MKWEPRTRPSVRYRAGFLLFPREIDGEVRWLEWAAWKETRFNHGFWHEKQWIDSVSDVRECGWCGGACRCGREHHGWGFRIWLKHYRRDEHATP